MKRGVMADGTRALRRLLSSRPRGDARWRDLFRRYPQLLGATQTVEFEVSIPGLPARRADLLTGATRGSPPGTYFLWELEGADSPVFTRRHGTIVPHWTLTLGLQQLEDWKIAIEKYLKPEYLRERCPGFGRMRYELMIGQTLPSDFRQKLIEKNHFVLEPLDFHVMTYADLLEYLDPASDK